MRGLEFLDGEGVRRKMKGVLHFEGRDGFAEFRKDVLAEAKISSIDICVSDVDDRLFDKWGEGEVNDNYRSSMERIKNKRCRILCRKGDTHFPASGFAEYRWIPNHNFGDFPFYLYGDKTAMMMFEENRIDIFIINHSKITNFYRKQFDAKWRKAQRPYQS